MKILCTICARSKSKGLKNKNIKLLNDKPLISYTINQAIRSNIFHEIIISTDSKKIEKIALSYGIKSIGKRPDSLSNNTISKIDVIRHAVSKFEKSTSDKYYTIIDLDITSPLRKISDIKNSFKMFKNNNTDNLITVCESRKNPYFNMVELKNKKVKLVKRLKNKISSRQKAPKVFEMNASIYIWKRDVLFSKNPLFRKKTSIYEMPYERSIDIDSIQDFEIVKFYMKNNK
tara:strand:- start:1242 stop:1934 length:693 start_codon:yes stop_codon:yes gene_type:complete